MSNHDFSKTLGDPQPTDWLKEAHMYAEVIGKIKKFCDVQHKRMTQRGIEEFDCNCGTCETKKRIQRIISDNLK